MCEVRKREFCVPRFVAQNSQISKELLPIEIETTIRKVVFPCCEREETGNINTVRF